MAAACAAATKRMPTKNLEMNMAILVVVVCGGDVSTGWLISSKEIHPRFYICSLISYEHDMEATSCHRPSSSP
jgi:hypothetical protein